MFVSLNSLQPRGIKSPINFHRRFYKNKLHYYGNGKDLS